MAVNFDGKMSELKFEEKDDEEDRLTFSLGGQKFECEGAMVQSLRKISRLKNVRLSAHDSDWYTDDLKGRKGNGPDATAHIRSVMPIANGHYQVEVFFPKKKS